MIEPVSRELIRPFEAVTERSENPVPPDAGPAIGYFCTYTPIELLHAAGFTPIRITGGAGGVEKAYSRMPDFICPFMKRALEKALNGQYAFLSGVVQGYSCDAACGAVNIWRDAVGGDIYHTLPLPYNATAEAEAFFKSAVKELIAKLETIGGRFTESGLDQSLRLYEETRRILLDIYQRLHEGNSALNAQQILTVTEAAATIPPETYLKMLQTLSNELANTTSRQAHGIPVMISGSLVEDMGIIEMIESAGGRIVADDLCNGYRPLVPPAGEGQSPVDRLVNRYMQRLPCPSRSRAEDRTASMLEVMEKSGAKGLILILQKFCTPHLSDYPSLSDAFRKKGLPVLCLEMDESWQPGGQVKTRLESFFEMLEI